jgi:tRNA A37 threonylcarbamoyladenosine synthetase subunit TsaC/SUA5/YrdC
MDLEMLIDDGNDVGNDARNAGSSAASLGSTILDLSARTPKVLREGPVSRDALCQALNGNIE